MSATPLTALSRLDANARAEYWAALALRRTRGLGPRSIKRLLHHFGSAYEAVYQVSRWGDAGVPASKGASLSGDAWREEARPEWEDSRDLDGDILLWTDPRYPAPLRELPDAPALLYCRGDLSLLGNPCVAIVGSRACSPHSQQLAHEIARDLSACGVTVVSGMARGIDYAAHMGALPEQGRTIAVFGAGLDVIYPPQHKALYHSLGIKGLLISEFPPGTRPQGPLFPVRNRIISGLSLGVLVVEAAHRSGSLVTARLALEQNRGVYAVPPPGWTPMPGNIDEEIADKEAVEGCSALLLQGARPVCSAADILGDLLPQLQSTLDNLPPAPARPASLPAPPEPSKPDVPPRSVVRPLLVTPSRPPTAVDIPPPPPVAHVAPDSPEARLLALLRELGPVHPDDILEYCGEDFDAGRLSALLVILEVKGSARCLPGSFYQAV